MRHVITQICVILLFVIVGCNRPGDTTLNNTEQIPQVNQTIAEVPRLRTINITNMKFQPEEIKVRQGDTLIWRNNDIVTHCITEEKGHSWTSSELKKDSTWKMVATSSADYFCALHQVMKGRIIVE